MKVAVFDVNTMSLVEKDIEDELDVYYEIIDCQTIDIVTRKVNGRWFDIICDDEGLLKDEIVVSAIDRNLQTMLVGTLIFTHHDGAGYTTGISDDDVKCLKDATQFGIVFPCEYL